MVLQKHVDCGIDVVELMSPNRPATCVTPGISGYPVLFEEAVVIIGEKPG